MYGEVIHIGCGVGFGIAATPLLPLDGSGIGSGDGSGDVLGMQQNAIFCVLE